MNRAQAARLVRALLPALLCAASAHAAMVLDSFTDLLPSNPCLPNSGREVVFVGEYCDGFYCPPDPLATCDYNTAEQPGLPGVLGGVYRTVTVVSGNGLGPLEAAVSPALTRLDVRAAAGHAHELDLQYGGDGAFQMNLDLASQVVTDLVLQMQGDLTPTRPLHVEVLLSTMEAIPGGFVSHATVRDLVVDNTGPLSLPLSSFPPSAGFSLGDLDMVLVRVASCPISQACATPPPLRSYSLGPISFAATGPVPTARTTWTRLKAHYR